MADNKLIYKEPVSIIITTKNRFDSFSKYLEKIISTTGSNPILIACDDDKTSFEKLKEKFGHFEFVKIYNSPYQMENVSLRNWLYKKVETEKFVYMDDDMEPGNNEWLIIALDYFNKLFPDNIGLVSFCDGIQNGKLAPAGLTTKTFINRACNGYLYNPQYVHYFCDTEITVRAQIINRYAYCADAILLHRHATVTGNYDFIYNQSKVFWKQDEMVFNDFMEKVMVLKKKLGG
ncbi:MAG TPA: glycosyltransferase family A protein [bacterium]|nr:glycosyltransferase family A protein [bacterium]HPQ17822.1 glycosyltransferase family A protein [bacterium]